VAGAGNQPQRELHPNKKLRLLEMLDSESDHDDDAVLSDSSAIHRVMQEIAAYLGPTVLT
jgi:hypothetical protein